MAIDWTRTICVIDDDTVNLICGKEILYVRGIAAGRGIVSITKTSTVGLVDTYTIYYSDGTTSTFDVTNGEEARGIDDIQKTSTTENVDTYTIYYSDGTTSTFDVTNGTYIPGVEGTVTVQRSRITSGFIFYNLPTEEDGTAELMSLEIVPAQSGSGTPSTSNIRPLLYIDRLRWYIYETGGDDTGTLKFLPEASYGGTWDIVSGKYTKTWEHIASYAGETLPGRWISDRDAYAAGTTPTIGAEVAYELATPVEISGAGSMTVPFFDGGTEVAFMLTSTLNEASLGGLTASKVPGKVKIKDYIDELIPEDAPSNGYFYFRRNGDWHNVKNGIVLYVDGTNGSDSNDGSTAEKAFKTIQTAINKSSPNTANAQIIIAAGTYSETVTIQNIGCVLTANGTVTLTGVWTVVKAIVLLEGTKFDFTRMLRIYHNAYVADNGLSSLVISTLNANENSLEVVGATFVARGNLDLGYFGTSNNYACYASAGAKVALGSVNIQGNYGLYAEYGAIIGAASLTGGTVQKTTFAGGRIFIGEQNDNLYGFCQTAASTAAKVVTIPGFVLETGVTIHVKFQNSNSATAPTLNVSNTGAIAIKRYGNTSPGTSAPKDGWQSGSVLTLTYDGAYWVEHYWFNTVYTFDVTPDPNSGNPVQSYGIYNFVQTAVQTAMEEMIMSMICIHVTAEDNLYKLSYCGPFEISEADGIYYLNWCGMAETCPFTVELVGTDYVLKYNE